MDEKKEYMKFVSYAKMAILMV